MCTRLFHSSDFNLRPGYVLWTFVTVFCALSTTLALFWTPIILSRPRQSLDTDFLTMTEKKCCVPNCGSEKEILHKFPNPSKDPERFRSWVYKIGGDILALDNDIIFKRRRVCHLHFDARYHTRSKFLSADAVPGLCLPGSFIRRPPLIDITNQGNTSSSADVPPPDLPPEQTASTKSIKSGTKNVVSNENILVKQIKKLKTKNNSYQMRLKKALKLSTNTAFQAALLKFKTLAAIFTIMQFREISKPKMGRRFTKEEKIMALSIYKVGPKAYRWLSKIFVLPSPVTLSRMVSKASLRPGINNNIFDQLKRKIGKMKADDRLCTLLFDEMALSPHFDYNQKKDRVSGFVNHTGKSIRKIADHVLVFMIRGITKNYKQPIYYSFCSGSTPKEVLAGQIKEIIKKLHSIGFTVLTTICDQGTSNVSAINYLIEDTKRHYAKRNLEYKNNTVFEIEGKTIIPLYDVPHLLKGMRNNLITKNLKFTMDGAVKMAKWEHIMQLYENNPTYKGLKIIKNLTENHCNKEKIPKMKVKYASQLFSQTVGKTMGYLAENGILPEETKDTADFILFIDNLFDSLNGSQKNSSVRSGKDLLRCVTPNSRHKEIWLEAKLILKSMTFTSRSSAGTVPSIKNWIKTVENMETLRETLFDKYMIKSFWCRHLNQDPLENFFGSIRSHGVRNNSPTCAGFEAAFASLLINNMSSNYSPGSNCEEDFCSAFESFDELFFSQNKNAEQISEVDFNDLSENIIISYDIKKKDPRIIGQLQYVTGYILRKAKKIVKRCKNCKVALYTNDPSENRYLQHREYLKSKNYLCYPSENFTKSFSEIQDILHHILRNKSHMENLKNYMKTVLYVTVNTKFIQCKDHRNDLIEYIFDFTSRFFAYNWCKWSNKLLDGTSTSRDVDIDDSIQNQALLYCNKRRKSKKISLSAGNVT